MTEPIRQQIMDNVDTGLKTVLQRNGYFTDLGNNVFRWRDLEKNPFSASELPGINFKDVTDERESLTFESDLHTLTVELIVACSEGEDTTGAVNEIISDLINLVGANTTWGGIALQSELQRTEGEIKHAENLFGAIDLRMIIRYVSAKASDALLSLPETGPAVSYGIDNAGRVWGSGLNIGGTDHATNDDHTGYAKLAGRSGGQTLYGGTGSGQDLTLYSTSHLTKGKIKLGTSSAYDEVNDRLGLGTVSPASRLHVKMTNLDVRITPLGAFGYGGLDIDKASADTTNAASLTWLTDGSPKWSEGLDIANADFYIAYDWSIPGDVLRMSPGSKLILGPGIGSPSAEDALFTVSCKNGAGTILYDLDCFAGRVQYNNLRGMTLTNFSTGNAAGARIKLASDSFDAYLDLMSSNHATRPNQARLYTATDTPLILGSKDTDMICITDHGVKLGTLGDAIATLDVTQGDVVIRSTTPNVTRSLTLYPAYNADATNKLTISATTGDKTITSSSGLALYSGNNGDITLSPNGSGKVIVNAIKIGAVQVVGARVIDARIDDAINTSVWDATTAGVLTAIRDALLTHGTVAAS